MLTAILRSAAQIDPEGLGTLSAIGGRSWRNFQRDVMHLAGRMKAHGLAPGNVVALLGEVTEHSLDAFYAAPWCGAILAPLNFRWSVQELDRVLDEMECRIVLVTAAFADLASRLGRTTKTPFVILRLDDERADPHAGRALPDVSLDGHPVSWDTPLLILYTSGSTAFPKGAVLTHGNMWSNMLSVAASDEWHRNSRFLHVSPLFHANGAMFVYLMTLLRSTHVLIPRFEANAVIDALSETKATGVSVDRVMLNMMMASPRLAHSDISRLSNVIYGGAPMTLPIYDWLMSTLADPRPSGGYGLTEATFGSTILSPAMHRTRDESALATAGHVVDGVEIKVVDDSGARVPAHANGHIQIRGPHITKGYFRQPEATSRVIDADGWLSTGDLGSFDERGLLTVVGRAKDMIKTGGENVAAAEVERVIYLHPAVTQCAVIGLQSEMWGESVHAIAYVKPGEMLDPKDLEAFCRQHLAGYKVPKSIEMSPAPLPVTESGKVDKVRIRQKYQANGSGSAGERR
jgi:long-chain acyl-CoA synthetase